MKLPAQLAILLGAALAILPNLPGRTASAPPPAQQDQENAAKSSSGKSSEIPETLPKGKKLILKDGTYQLAREYSVEGDRVRYWSVERSQWEEIPSALVDWDATHKSEAAQDARDADLKAKIHADNIARLTKDIDVDRSLEIKPGLFLPDDVGLYAIDRDKEIRTLKQSTAEVKVSAGREAEKILTGVALINSKKTMDIPGSRAALRLSTAEPEFFFRPADGREPRFRLLRAQLKGGKRVIDNIAVHFTGDQTDKVDEIEIQTWVPATGVYRYTMDQRLESGEYAFVEMTPDGISGYVWDFGIDLPETKKK